VGIAALRVQEDAGLVELRPTGQFDYQLIRRAAKEESSELRIALVYRGHVTGDAIPVGAPNTERGPTVVYVDERPNEVELVVRLDQSDRSDMKVLFLLDCSFSMREGTPSKMFVEQKVLRQFMDSTPPNAIDVGVRLFGSRFSFTNADIGTEAVDLRHPQE